MIKNLTSNDCSINLKLLKIGYALEIFSDIRGEKIQPYVPERLRFEVFSSLHNLFHPVGPFPPSDSFTYLLTCIEHYNRWPEAIPLSYMSEETVPKCFIANWVSRFGVPSILTTDQRRQFKVSYFLQLKIHVRNTAHPNYSVPHFFEWYG
ncbi:retrovirus-related Pol polyprotein from transposon 17.6 [Nephila pilipes]|uniref:Retrovirus-related Pol polyprotein from transposon 17.6 n=1 Tax=Nephila pilipes TaxID=299642 RepID=A0A8X6N4Q8_NEPPI|nr:retrovirus-related Pol polyprotein from transposon 17.6 [Nephila pilipes]